jgi:hypothetical protein
MKSVRFVIQPEIIGEPPKPQTGMWAATKRDTDLTARQSLEGIARSMNSPASDEHEHTFERSKMSLRKNLEDARFVPSINDLKNWIWSFSKCLFPPQKGQMLTSFIASADRAARIERDWEEAVKKAYATHAVHKHMASSSYKRQLGGSSLTFSQDDLASARERHNGATAHPEIANQAEQTGPAGPAGSIWSNEPVVFPSQEEQVITHGLRPFKPTPPRATTFDAGSANVLDHESGDASPKLQKSSSVAAVDVLMECGDGMISFGRWRHHKDAPLSLVKDMIDRDLRDPGRCALYGPGGLGVFDHPLVNYYNDRLQKIQQGENCNASSSAPPLYPITASHVRLQCPLLQTLQTPPQITFHMDKDSMFTATGFYTRTASMSSTIESGSSVEDDDSSAGDQEDARHDSGAGEAFTSPSIAFKRVDNRNPSQVMRPYTPDSGLNILGINNGTIPRYRKNLIGYTSEKYRIDFCDGTPRPLAGPSAPDVATQPPTTHMDTPQLQAPMQIEHRENVQQRKNPQQYGYAMQRTGHHVRLTDYYKQPEQHVQAKPHVQCGPQREPPATEVAGKQGKQVNGRRLPGLNARQITLVSAKDADDAMWSDDESDDEPTPKPQFGRRALVLPPMTSLISKMIADSAAQGTATVRPREDEIRASATRSGTSSFNSTTANTIAGLNTSTDPTPTHITPGTTASSGARIIKSPAHAESIARRLADHLNKAIDDQDETSQISF